MFGLFGKKQQSAPPVQQKPREISPEEEALASWESRYRSSYWCPFDESFLLEMRGFAYGNGGLVTFFRKVSERLDDKYHIPLEALFEFGDDVDLRWQRRRSREQALGLESSKLLKAYSEAESWIPAILDGLLTFLSTEKADDYGVDKAKAAHIAALVTRFCKKTYRYWEKGQSVGWLAIQTFRRVSGKSGYVDLRQEVSVSTLDEADLLVLSVLLDGEDDVTNWAYSTGNVFGEHDQHIGPVPLDRYQRFLYNGPAYRSYVTTNNIRVVVDLSDLRKINRLAVSWWNENPNFPGSSDLVASILANPGLFCEEAIQVAKRLDGQPGF